MATTSGDPREGQQSTQYNIVFMPYIFHPLQSGTPQCFDLLTHSASALVNHSLHPPPTSMWNSSMLQTSSSLPHWHVHVCDQVTVSAFLNSAPCPHSSVRKSDVTLQCVLPTALQVVVPFGVALPLVKKESRRGRSGRPLDAMPDHEHPTYGTRLARLDYYFSQLEVSYTVTHRPMEYFCKVWGFHGSDY
jgi:hypothetical protein